MHAKITLLVLCVYLSACSEQNIPISQSKSDTTQVIELAIRSAFYGYLPDASAIKGKYYSNNSMLFTSKSLQLSSLPMQVDTLKFKILSEDEVCRIMKPGSLSETHINYLCLRSFEKSDTGYYVQLQSLNCFPYGGGGSLGLYISKVGDSFIIKSKMAVSIN